MPVYGAGAQPSTRDEIAELCRNVLRLPTRVSPTAPWVALATPTPSSCAALGCVPRMASVAARVSGGAAYGADIAAAQQVFAARQRLGEDVVGLAHAIKTHALARLGELLAEMPKATTVIVAARGCFRHQLLLPRPYLVLTKPLRLDIQCQRGASVKIGWKYLDD